MPAFRVGDPGPNPGRSTSILMNYDSFQDLRTQIRLVLDELRFLKKPKQFRFFKDAVQHEVPNEFFQDDHAYFPCACRVHYEF